MEGNSIWYNNTLQGFGRYQLHTSLKNYVNNLTLLIDGVPNNIVESVERGLLANPNICTSFGKMGVGYSERLHVHWD